MKQLSFIGTVLVLVLLVTDCNQQPNIDISKTLDQTRETLKELDDVETTAASFDGESDIKFRLMVEGHPTEEEAISLFNKILENITKSSTYSDVWDYYNGYFDIKSYDNGVIYEATKLIGEDFNISSN
ncbi:IolE/MocC family protein [Bacillus solitudinis]|uniref:hypothetical protein n=1 Tax=Bacillus solitudinis TaxID=2014074 RepID=UPI000C25063E|nr:hypothetical protein [Bacillus solitudinis]